MRFYVHLLFIGIFWITGCTGPRSNDSEATIPFSTPTLHPIFGNSEDIILDQTESSPVIASPTSIETEEEPTPTVRPTIAAQTVSLFDEALNENWTLENSLDFEYDLESEQVSNTGRRAIALTPLAGNGKLRFTVSPESEEEFLRENVLAFRFWLYSGDDYIGTEDLSVSIVGSNESPFWIVDDDSVQVDDELPTFSQTRLYFLDVNSDIPPDTWIQIEVWLNELLFDPDYLYVTGIILENDEDYLNTFYVDDLEMIIQR